jgi:hypothetical protein
MRKYKIGIIFIILLLVAFGACGDNSNGRTPKSYTFQTKLSPSDGDAHDCFGTLIAVSGDTMAVGAPFATGAAFASGAIYVFRYNGTSWIEEAKLTASDGAANDYFGVSVAISGDTIVVGASEDMGNYVYSGAVYVYRYNGTSWIEEAKLTASNGAAEDAFGGFVAVSGDTIVVASSEDIGNYVYSAAVYVYRYNGTSWIQETRIPAGEDHSGEFVAVNGDMMVYGCSIYRYDGIAWKYETKFTSRNLRYVNSVAISADMIVFGYPWDDENGLASGSAYIYRYDGSKWQETKLTAGDGVAEDHFGRSVAVSGDTIVVGTQKGDENGSASGYAYIYRYDGSKWQETKLTAGDGVAEDHFGVSAAVSDNTIVIGAPADDDNGTNSGSAYVYRVKQNRK